MRIPTPSASLSVLRARIATPGVSRAISSSTVQQFPRAPVRARTATTQSSDAPPTDLPSFPSAHTTAKDEHTAPEADNGEGDPPESLFPGVVTTLMTPTPTDDKLAPELRSLYNHLATSFVPANQPAHSSKIQDSPLGKVFVPGERSSEDPVIALVSPFEGGDVYNAKAVHDVASQLNADVVRLDLALGVGFDGPSAPLADTGITAPPLPMSVNPLFQTQEAPEKEQQQPGHEDDQGIEGEDDPHGMPNMIRLPMFAVAGGESQFGGMQPGARRPEVNEEWVNFFSSIINMQSPQGDTADRRVILLESTAAMSPTFEIWWPSFLEAVRQRRRGPPPPKTPKSAKASRPAVPTTTKPTTIVLSIPPSLLPTHMKEFMRPSDTVDPGHEDRIRGVIEAFGNSVGQINVIDGSERGEQEKLWWSGEERDMESRKKREERRLNAIFAGHNQRLLPAFASSSNSAAPANPILEMLTGGKKQKGDPSNSNSIVWKIVPVVPANRDRVLEQHERHTRRRALNAAIMTKAVSQLGAALEEPKELLEVPGTTSPARGRARRLERRRNGTPEWSEFIIPWKEAVDLASFAVGRAAMKDPKNTDRISLTWKDIEEARNEHYDSNQAIRDTVFNYIDAELKQRKAAATEAEKGTGDSTVEDVKNAKDLNKHEKRLLHCIVDPKKISAASFKDVHLPFKTIDAVRTVISLPLLFPEAFQGGILKDHVTSGALLFGPPGTGKTLLARAIAAESGARMIAIQPSDVNDMWVGEGEKLVKGVFSLARRLAPCVVFIDEVDSLFGARSARDSSGGSKAHNQILTEFMQEMDGLSSASANRDARVVVVGATNRPFDLDDAILRRLPRRLLVDLPTEDDRKAILEILLKNENLAPDVDLRKLAKKTEGFSGSDLKHLCVAAALASVKDDVVVPWKQHGAKAIKVKPVHHASGSVHHPDTGGNRTPVSEPMKQPKQETPAPAIATEGKAVPHACADAVNPTVNNSVAAKMLEAAHEAVLNDLKAGGMASLTQSRGFFTSATASDAKAGTPKVPSASESPDSPSQENPEDAEPIAPQKLTRVLRAKHFETALGEIRPSSSEEGTIGELRKWAELYGEGGTKKGKKSGFGKGFGFGEEALTQKGFGRVDADAEA